MRTYFALTKKSKHTSPNLLEILGLASRLVSHWANPKPVMVGYSDNLYTMQVLMTLLPGESWEHLDIGTPAEPCFWECWEAYKSDYWQKTATPFGLEDCLYIGDPQEPIFHDIGNPGYFARTDAWNVGDPIDSDRESSHCEQPCDGCLESDCPYWYL